MIDISKYTAKKNSIKPILEWVKVEVTGNLVEAYATDSFRLAKVIEFRGSFADVIEPGFYTSDAWKKITKIYNKKNFPQAEHLNEIASISKQQMAVQPDEKYPEVERIIPEQKELQDFDATLNVNYNYFIDLLKDIGGTNKWGMVDWSRIKQKDNMIVYEDAATIILIMQMKK